jgi:hypothetical protein
MNRRLFSATGRTIAIAALIAIGPVFARAAAQQVVSLEAASPSLEGRFDEALSRAENDEGHVLVAYGLTVRAPANQIWGMWTSRKTSLPTVGELISDRMASDSDRRFDTDDDRIVDREAAVLARLDADGRVEDIGLHTLNSIADFRIDRIYWLGEADSGESFDILRRFVYPGGPAELRRDAVYALARHTREERVFPLLTRIVRDESEPLELRKAAIYGLGQQHSEQARDYLLQLIHTSSS